MKKKWISLALCSAMLLSALSGCSNSSTTSSEGSSTESSTSSASEQNTSSDNGASDATLRFMWWGGETRHKATVEAMDLFMEKNPGIKVEYEYGGFSGYFDKLLTQMAGNNAPDVVQLSYTNVIEYVTRNQLEPLSSYIDEGILNVDKINETLLDTYKIDEDYYAIPSGINVQLLFYNKTMFDDLSVEYPTSGMTFDEVYAKAKEITDAARAQGKTDIWGISAYSNAFDVNFQRILIDFGGQLWTDDLSAAAFNSPEGIAAMEYIKQPLTDEIAPPPEITVSNPDGVTDFALGRVGMYIDNATSTAGFAAIGDFELGLELAPFGNNHNVTWYQASQVYSITNQSEHPDIAAQIIDYLVNDKEAGKILAFERGIPVNDDIRATSGEGMSEIEQKQLELVNGAAEYMDDGVPMPFPPGYLEIHTEFERIQESYFYGQQTAEEALAELEDFANKTISKFN